jgi:hypothetical protein
MNQVDIYIGDYRLDLFQDEEISINLNVQNIQDISKVFTISHNRLRFPQVESIMRS